MAKQIIIKKIAAAKPVNQTIQSKLNNRFNSQSTFGESSLPPTWGKVSEIVGINHVNVILTNGMLLKYVPVKSDLWVYKKDDGTYGGKKNIPPVGTKVLILFIDGIVENAIVWGSGFDSLVEGQKTTLLKEGEDNIVISIDEFGWKKTYDKETGNITFESPDDVSGKKITFSIDLENNVMDILQQFSTTAKNQITSDSNSVNLTQQFDAVKKNSIITNKDKIEIKKTEASTDYTAILDSLSQLIQLNIGQDLIFKLNGVTKKISMKNNSFSLLDLLSDLNTIMSGLTTTGSPVTHSINADGVAKLAANQVKLNLLLE